MSDRLQVLISPELNAQIRKAARRDRVSKGEWVRRAFQDSLLKWQGARANTDPLGRLGSLNAPTANIEQMLSEINLY
jgi:hypothetical protein